MEEAMGSVEREEILNEAFGYLVDEIKLLFGRENVVTAAFDFEHAFGVSARHKKTRQMAVMLFNEKEKFLSDDDLKNEVKKYLKGKNKEKLRQKVIRVFVDFKSM
jgi:hypothetical protein